MPSASTTPSTLASLIAAFTSHLTVAIHSILYARNVYPASTFLSARAYNFPVHQSRHPAVCAWISDAVKAVETELRKATVDKVALVIAHPESHTPLEKWVWDVSRWPRVPSGELETDIVREDALSSAESSDSRPTRNAVATQSVDLDEQLRALMSKLDTAEKRLMPVPEGCTYTLAMELKDEVDPPIGQPQPWIPAEPSVEHSKGPGLDKGRSRVIPLRNIEAGEMLFEAWIEEGKAKYEITELGNGSSEPANASTKSLQDKTP